jgi:hypothetical protein
LSVHAAADNERSTRHKADRRESELRLHKAKESRSGQGQLGNCRGRIRVARYLRRVLSFTGCTDKPWGRRIGRQFTRYAVALQMDIHRGHRHVTRLWVLHGLLETKKNMRRRSRVRRLWLGSVDTRRFVVGYGPCGERNCLWLLRAVADTSVDGFKDRLRRSCGQATVLPASLLAEPIVFEVSQRAAAMESRRHRFRNSAPSPGISVIPSTERPQ